MTFQTNFPLEPTKLPYITVSAKGMSNGLSDIPNDGFDFGPDTMLGTSSKGLYGPPYSPTLGIQEAVNYIFNNGGGVIYFNPGEYDITNSPFQTDPVSGHRYKIAIPVQEPNTKPIMRISLVSQAKALGQYRNSEQTSPFTSGGVIIKDLTLDTTAQNSASDYILGTFTTSTNNSIIGTNISTYIDGIEFVTNDSSTNMLGGLDLEYTAQASFGVISIRTNSLWPASYNNATGLFWSVGGGHNIGNFAEFIGVSGYLWGVISTFPHTTVSYLYGVFCNQVVNCTNYVQGGNGNYDSEISMFSFETSNVGIAIATTTAIGINIGMFAQGDLQSSGTFAYQYSIQNIYPYGGGANIININSFGAGPSGIIPQFNLNSLDIVNINQFSEGVINGSGIPTNTVNGTTAGTVTTHLTSYGSYYKKYVIAFSGYENDTATNQTINYPLSFSSYAVITGNNTGLTISTTTSGITITSPNSTTTYSGIVIVEGY